VRFTTSTANLRDLLLAAPAGARPTMGLDPGLRSGVKVTTADRPCVASPP
jgi:transcriptional accessory protein Tex/SPT6